MRERSRGPQTDKRYAVIARLLTSAAMSGRFSTMWANGSPGSTSSANVRNVGRTASLSRLSVTTMSAIGCDGTFAQIADIAELQLERLRSRLAERKLSLELTDAAKEVLAEAGWDPTYGARPLKRALQRLVENPLAQRLLQGEFAEGDTIRVDAQNGELVFEHAAEPARVG